jgi:molecular chaperone GrpE
MSRTEKSKLTDEELAVESDSTEGATREIPVGGGESESREEPAETSPADPIAELEARVRDLEDQKLRVLADMDNLRKRMTRRFDDVVQSANDRILGEILEVVDNFERALAHTPGDEPVEGKALFALREGTDLIYQQLQTLLERYGVRTIESIGRPFDPAYHEAMMQVDSDEYDDGVVASEITRGYMIADRVLRHARVAVSRGKGAKKDAN